MIAVLKCNKRSDWFCLVEIVKNFERSFSHRKLSQTKNCPWHHFENHHININYIFQNLPWLTTDLDFGGDIGSYLQKP